MPEQNIAMLNRYYCKSIIFTILSIIQVKRENQCLNALFMKFFFRILFQFIFEEENISVLISVGFSGLAYMCEFRSI